jgi:Xaa-Pro aminopeptidase
MFSDKTYHERRKRLKEQVGGGLILFLGNGESPMNYKDNTYPFRQDSSFLYFFGLGYAGLAGVIDADEGKETIFGNDLTVDDIVWMGIQPTIKEKSRKTGVENTAPAIELARVVKEAQSKGRKIHFLPPYRPEHFLQLFDLLGIHPSKITGSASVDLVKAVVAQRNTKTGEEIAEIDKACVVTADMHLAAYQMARPGLTEARIAATVHEKALSAGCDLAFPIIATVHGETLHNHYHGNTLKSGDMFLLDAGAQTDMGYAGDMSSTMPVDGTFTPRQKEIYSIALDAHEAAVAALKPGTLFRDVHLAAAKTITQGMRDIGLMKGDVDDAVVQGAHALFFPCGTGHMMGLDVHDMENLGEQYVGYSDDMKKSTQFGLKSLRLGRKMEPGFVVTIEPGIYFIPELIDMWKA